MCDFRDRKIRQILRNSTRNGLCLSRTGRRGTGRPASSAGTSHTFFPNFSPPCGWTRPPRRWRRSWTSSSRDIYLSIASRVTDVFRFISVVIVSPPRESFWFGKPRKSQIVELNPRNWDLLLLERLACVSHGRFRSTRLEEHSAMPSPKMCYSLLNTGHSNARRTSER